MASAEIDQTAVEIADAKGRAGLRATGSVIAFDGFLKLYREDTDDAGTAADDENRMLPPMQAKDPLKLTGTGAGTGVAADQHFTQPPPRFSEASLVKKMEELGIGRPSTYASILQVLQDREYVTLDAKRFVPQDRGRLVTQFLVSFFERYVDTGFTAALEEQLDTISDGRADWRVVMHAFWHDFSAAVAETKDLKISDVIDVLDEALGPHFFPRKAEGGDPRLCPSCSKGRLGLRLGRIGAFIGCSAYPECRYTRPLAVPGAEGEEASGGFKVLGTDAPSGQEVTLRRGPYGLYVQLGEGGTDDKGKPTKPRRSSLTKGMDPDTVDLERAMALLSLPRIIGVDPETKEEISAGVGRFGPYIRAGSIFQSLEAGDDVLALGMNRAMELLAKGRAKIRPLGLHPKDAVSVDVRKGRFGPYVQHGSTVANLPRGVEMEAITLDEALTLLAEKGKVLAPKKGAKGKARAPARKAAPKAAAAPKVDKAPAKKAPAKKATAKKAAAKRTPVKKAAAKKPARGKVV